MILQWFHPSLSHKFHENHRILSSLQKHQGFPSFPPCRNDQGTNPGWGQLVKLYAILYLGIVESPSKPQKFPEFSFINYNLHVTGSVESSASWCLSPIPHTFWIEISLESNRSFLQAATPTLSPSHMAQNGNRYVTVRLRLKPSCSRFSLQGCFYVEWGSSTQIICISTII